MQKEGFYLNKINYEEGLDIDYISEAEGFKGNIGVSFDEENSDAGRRLFKFYVLKTYDTIDHRFYKKEKLDQSYSLEEVETMFNGLFAKCISIYRNIQKPDLKESIKLIT